MMGHKICFYVEIWLITPRLSLLHRLIWSTAIGLSNQCRPRQVFSGSVLFDIPSAYFGALLHYKTKLFQVRTITAVFSFFFFLFSILYFIILTAFCMNLECNITPFSRYCFITTFFRIIIYCNGENATTECTNLLKLGEELYKQYASVPILFIFV